MNRRIAITGMGIASCLGNDLEDAAKSLRELDSHMPSSDQFGGVNGEPIRTEEDDD